MEPLVWSKRLAYRYVETRNPATGIGGSQYTRPKVDRAQLQFGDDFKGHVVLEGTLCPPNPFGLLESVVRPRICQLLLGETLGSDGQQFIQWALEELTAWGKVAYRRKDNSFVPILTDGTSLEGYVYTKGGYFGREGTVVKSIPAGQLTFWTYTLAYRVTREEFMWQMARNIARGNNFGDIGVSSDDEPKLEIITKCSDPYALLGFLELYKETGKKAFLDIATRIGDNILAERFHNGFFVPSKQALYTKFDYIEPLVLLRLNAAVNARPSSVPRVWPSRSFFACPYDAHEGGEDTFVIYGRTEATDLTRLLHEAAWDGKIDKVKSLFSKGANVNAGTTVDYLTVQRILRISNALDTAQIATLTGTTTALHYAAQRGHMDVVDWLIAKGADVDAINSAGDTPLHYAAKAGHKNIVELLIVKEADVNAKTDKGETAISLATNKGHTEIVELLRKHTADLKPIKVGPKSALLSPTGEGGMDEVCDLILDSPAPGKQNFGWDPACGDVNGDGYDDVVATAAAWNNGARRGRVYLYYGGTNMDAIPDKIFTGEADGDYFGDGCRVGDVNGDNYADVLVGAPCFSGGAEDGRVYVFHGGPDMDEKADLILEGESGAGGYYGIDIGAGDLNKDGYDDVVVTALKMNSGKGRAYLYYGGNPMDATCDLTFDGENANDWFGRTLFLGDGDVNGDDYPDLLMQARNYPGGKNRGRIYLYYGGNPMDNICDKTFTGENDRDEFGEGNCLIDVDNDGFCDVIIGADCWPARKNIQGRAYLYWGSKDMDIHADKTFTGEPGAALSVVYGGYFNNDEYGDILIGAWGYKDFDLRGQAHIYHGSIKGQMDEVADCILSNDAPKSRFGMRLTSGDVNGDGYDDAIINGFGYKNQQGRIWLFYGGPTKPQPTQEIKSLDEAYLESLRTEVHPKSHPKVSKGVLFRSKVIIGKAGKRNLTGDVFTPKKIPRKPRPAIVFLHGGSWMFGSPSQFHHHADYLARKYGFFALSVDYRLSGEAKFPAALQDAKCAIRWIRSHAKKLNIDPERIAICGGSAGAHLASMVATTADVKGYEGNGGHQEFLSHVNAVILFNGEFDMWDLVKNKSLIEAMIQFIGGSSEEMPEKYDELSSVKRIHSKVPATLFLHGTLDKCVSHEQSVAFFNRLQEVGVHAELELYEDKPHAWFNREPDRTKTLKRMEKFLVSRFKLGEVKNRIINE